MNAVNRRARAWKAVQDADTSATALAAIGSSYPEFADAIGQHVNAYPGLVTWSHAVQTGLMPTPPVPPVPAG